METLTQEQREKNDKFKEIRHMASLCSCPPYISLDQLKMILKVLKGEHSE